MSTRGILLLIALCLTGTLGLAGCQSAAPVYVMTYPSAMVPPASTGGLVAAPVSPTTATAHPPLALTGAPTTPAPAIAGPAIRPPTVLNTAQ